MKKFLVNLATALCITVVVVGVLFGAAFGIFSAEKKNLKENSMMEFVHCVKLVIMNLPMLQNLLMEIEVTSMNVIIVDTLLI